MTMMIRSTVWALRFAVATTALIANPGPELIQTAEAAPKPTVALGAIEGKNSKQVRDWVHDSLRKSYEVTDAEEVVPKTGSNASYAKSAKALGTEWIVTGKIVGAKLVLTVRSASDGKVVDTFEVKGAGAKLKRAVTKEVPSGLASVISDEEETEEEVEEEEEAPPKKRKAAAAAPEEDEEEEEAPPEESDPDTSSEDEPSDEETEEGDGEGGGASKFPWLVFTGGLEAARRDLAYNDQLSDHYPYVLDPVTGLPTGAPQLSDYHLPMQPGGFVALELYPAALFSSGFVSNVGFVFDFHQMLQTKSSYSRDGETREFDNKTSRWSAGLRIRFPSETFEFGTTAAYGVHKFFLAGDEDNPIVPDVKYGFFKLGVDGLASFGKFALGGKLGVRLLGSLGELESLWFPGATGTGLEAGILGRYALGEKVGIVFGVDLLRYGFDFNAMPKNNRVAAGGAIDQYIIGHLGVRFALSSGATAAAGGASTEDGEEASADDASSDEEVVEEEYEEEEEEEEE